jgi:hypothetical protein
MVVTVERSPEKLKRQPREKRKLTEAGRSFVAVLAWAVREAEKSGRKVDVERVFKAVRRGYADEMNLAG